MTESGNVKKAALFVGLTFLLSWGLIGLYLGLGGQWVLPGATIVAMVYMFMPMVAAIIVQKVFYKSSVIGPLWVSFKLNWWFLVAWLFPPLYAGATIGVSILLPGVALDLEMTAFFDRIREVLGSEQTELIREQSRALPIHPLWIGLLQGMFAGITVNAIAAFGEELGWRGLLQKEIRHLNFWKMSAIIGLIWGIWHAPIILQGHNYPEHPQIGVFMMIAWTILLAPILSYVTIKAKSVIAASILHGTLNGTAGIAIMIIAGGSDLTVGATGLAGFIVLIFANLMLLMYDRFVAREPLMVAPRK